MQPKPYRDRSFPRANELQTYVTMVWSYLWLIALLTFLGAILAFGISQIIPKSYRTTTTLLIDEGVNSGPTDYNSVLASERKARTYAQLLVEEPVLRATIERLSLSISLRDLEEMVDSRRIPDTQLIELQVKGSNPQQVAEIANTIVTVFVSQTQAIESSRYSDSKQSLTTQIDEVQRQIDQTTASLQALGTSGENQAERQRLEASLTEYRQTYASLLQSFDEVRLTEAQAASTIIQVKPATIPDRPFRPSHILNTLLGAVIGLIVSVGIVIIKDVLDDTMKSAEQISEYLNLPIIAMISTPDSQSDPLITQASPRSPQAEEYRALRTSIQYAGVDEPIRSLLITSPLAREGKSTVASNLSVVMAQNGRETVLVEGDLHQPRVFELFSLPNQVGLTDLFIVALERINQFLQPTGITKLSVLTSGKLPHNPAELLGSERAANILEQLKENAEIVIIDSPPLTLVADPSVLAPQVDGVLLVIRSGSTKLAAAREALRRLDHVGANVLGLVVTGCKPKSTNNGYYYYGNGKLTADNMQPHAASAAMGYPHPEDLLAQLGGRTTHKANGNGTHKTAAVGVLEIPALNSYELPTTYHFPPALQPEAIPTRARNGVHPPQQAPKLQPTKHSGAAIAAGMVSGLSLGMLSIFGGALLLLFGPSSALDNAAYGVSLIIIGAGLCVLGVGAVTHGVIVQSGAAGAAAGTLSLGLAQTVISTVQHGGVTSLPTFMGIAFALVGIGFLLVYTRRLSGQG